MKTAYVQLLIVDSNETRYATLAEPLHRWGWYAVTRAADRQQALALMAVKTFDLILLDIEIAAQDNFAIWPQLQGDARLREAPIIVLSPAAGIERITQCIRLGASDYLLTPANPVLLRARISACLEKEQLQDQALSSLKSYYEMKKLADDLRQIILPLGAALSAEKGFDRLLERIVLEAKSICNADAGTLYLRTEDNSLRFVIVRTDSLHIAYGGAAGRPVPYTPLPLYDEETNQPNHHNVATYVALEGHSVNIPDIYHASGFDFSGTKAFDERNNYRSISCLTVPLKNYEVVGVLQLINAQDPERGRVIPFTVYHQLVAESLASQAAVVLHNNILRQRHESLLRYERDLQIGHELQLGFLPTAIPQPPGWELAAHFSPAREVAGDFYDIFSLPQDKIGLVIADVCGKGVAAALFMALVRSLIRAFTQHHFYLSQDNLPDPHPVSNTVEKRPSLPTHTGLLDTILLANAYIESNHSQAHMFATLFLGILNPATGQLLYINSGHIPPVILNANEVKEHLNPTGPAVGLLPDASFAVHESHLNPGDTLIAFTDGVTDARDPLGAFFTKKRLMSLLAHQTRSAGALLDYIESRVREHISVAGQFDDITMLAVRRRLGIVD